MPRELQKYTRYVNGLDDHEDIADDINAGEEARSLALETEETEGYDRMQEGRRVLGMAPKPLESVSALTRSASARLICMIVLVPVLCIAGGILIGSLAARSHYSAEPKQLPCSPAANASIPPPSTIDPPLPARKDTWFENPESIQSLASHFLSHMTPEVIQSHIRKISNADSAELMSIFQTTLEAKGFTVKKLIFPVITSTADNENPNRVELLKADGQTELLNYHSVNGTFYPFSGFSPNGSASGPLVYANFASDEDFKLLEKENLTVNGSVLLVRLGSVHPSTQVRNAEKRGAVAVILYPDFLEFEGSSRFPEGLRLPKDGVVWQNLRVMPGDPSTPSFASQKYAYRLPSEHYRGIPSIQVQPVSPDAAFMLMSSLDGSKVPEEWKGHLSSEFPLGDRFNVNVTDVRVTTYNVLAEQHTHAMLAYMPAQDHSKVIHVGCHYELRNSRLTSSGIGLASLLAVGDALNHTFPDGTHRRIVLSAFEGQDGDFSAGTEYSQLLAPWLESTAMAYIDMDSILEGSGSIESHVSPLFKDVVLKAFASLPWPGGVEGLTAIQAIGGNSIQNPYECDESVNFVNLHAIPSIKLTAVSLNKSDGFFLRNSQYDTMDAVIQKADPTLEWTHTIVSVLSFTMLSLATAVLPPVRFCDIYNDLSNAWDDFKLEQKDALNQSQPPLTDILDQIYTEFDQFRLTCHSIDSWYKDGADFKPDMTSYEKYRQVEIRLIELMHFGRRFLRPRSAPSEAAVGSLITYGPSLEDPCKGTHFPFIRSALKKAQEGTGSLETVREELSLLLGSLIFMRMEM